MKRKINHHKLDMFFIVAEVLQRYGILTEAPLKDRFASQKALHPEFSSLAPRCAILVKALLLGRAAGLICGGPARGWELTPEGEEWHRTMLQRIDPFCCSMRLSPEWRARFWTNRGASQTAAPLPRAA